MEATSKKKIFNVPVYILLLPVFFVLHGFTENYDFVPVSDALLLTALYIGSSIVIAILAWLLLRSFTKAFLFTFAVMAFHFFFGSVHDELKRLLPGVFFTKYVFIIPTAFIFFILMLIVLRKTRFQFKNLVRYLNILLIVLTLVDVVWLGSKIISNKQRSLSTTPEYNFTNCDTCNKPDIYLIIADAYAGNGETKDLFGFDNSGFENELRNRGFHVVPNSYSNYDYTPFSMASLLTMNYLHLKGKNMPENLTYCYETIKNNQALQFLQFMGYAFYNYSIFDFEGQPAQTIETFLPNKTKLITAQTFLSRVYGDLWFHTQVGKFKSESAIRKYTYRSLDNNERLYKLTWDITGQRKRKPRFIYTHLMMPHYPYYFDKDGNSYPYEKVMEGNEKNPKRYIEYLQYANKKLSALIDQILTSSSSPPIIILLGDHGYREFVKPVEKKYYFMNLNAVYLPNKNYKAFYDSLSSVNEFRVIFNSQFNQKLILLKDSAIFLSLPHS